MGQLWPAWFEQAFENQLTQRERPAPGEHLWLGGGITIIDTEMSPCPRFFWPLARRAVGNY